MLVFYHHPMALEVPFLWPGQMMPAPWANTTDTEKLIQFLQASVTDRRLVTSPVSTGDTLNSECMKMCWCLNIYSSYTRELN